MYCATIYVLDKMIDFGPLYDSFLARKLRRFHLQILAISGIIGKVIHLTDTSISNRLQESVFSLSLEKDSTTPHFLIKHLKFGL